MRIKRFNESKINESTAILYRLVSVPQGEHLVVNTKDPGKYYFKSEGDVDPTVLDNHQGGELHIIKVETDASNIDDSASNQESDKNGCDCVVLKDSSDAEIVEITPYKMAA
jgi:hypothetical protein